MVVRKTDVLSADAGHVKTALVKYEAQADALLERDGEAKISLDSEKQRFREVLGAELKLRYMNAGWQVVIQSGSDQRGGPWYYVKIT